MRSSVVMEDEDEFVVTLDREAAEALYEILDSAIEDGHPEADSMDGVFDGLGRALDEALDAEEEDG